MSLYKAELRRFGKRRFIRYAFLGGLVVLLLVLGGSFLSSEKNTPAALAQAQVEATAAYERDVAGAAQQKQLCEADKAAGRVPSCDEMTWTPQASDYRAEDYLPHAFNFRAEFAFMIMAFAAIIAMLAFITSASFVGAEWTSGGMTNLLLWRPRRLQVLGTKLAAALTGVTVLSVLTGALWTAGFWLTAVLRGTTEKMTPGVWQSLGLTWLRALALIAVAVIVGFALASLGRHTALALGVTVGVLVVLQYGLMIVLSLAQVRFVERYSVFTYIAAWMDKKMELEDYAAPCVAGPNGCVPPTLTIEWPLAGSLMAAVAVLVLGAAMWSMRSRDVT